MINNDTPLKVHINDLLDQSIAELYGAVNLLDEVFFLARDYDYDYSDFSVEIDSVIKRLKDLKP